MIRKSCDPQDAWIQEGLPMFPRSTILIADPDYDAGRRLQRVLEEHGFAAKAVTDGREVLWEIDQGDVGFLLLEIPLPQVDGWSICRRVREKSQLPIVFLTALGEEVDRISGLELGADDYLVKPYSEKELIARIKTILRRSQREQCRNGDRVTYQGLVLEPPKRKVSLHQQRLELTPSEYTLLVQLMTHPGRVFTRAELLNCLYPNGEAVIDRVVDVHIGRLRQKLEENPRRPRYIHTVRGVGYQFAE